MNNASISEAGEGGPEAQDLLSCTQFQSSLGYTATYQRPRNEGTRQMFLLLRYILSLQCSFNMHSLMTKDAEHFFMHLLAFFFLFF